MSEKPTYGFFHVALMDSFQGLMIAAEMLGRIQDSGIYHASQEIFIYVCGHQSQYEILYHNLLKDYPKYKVVYGGEDTSPCEWPTLLTLRNRCASEECDVWYVHTKGASFRNGMYGAFIRRSVADWRGVMSEVVLHRHAECKKALEAADAVGAYLWPAPYRHFPGKFFAGNFWWATSLHINSLPVLTPDNLKDREWAEAWIGTNTESHLKGFLEQFPADPYGWMTEDKESTLSVYSGLPGAM